MCRCHAYILARAYKLLILVNKSHNNAVITNDFFLLVYVIILFVLYILWNSGGEGGGIPVRPPVCNPAVADNLPIYPTKVHFMGS